MCEWEWVLCQLLARGVVLRGCESNVTITDSSLYTPLGYTNTMRRWALTVNVQNGRNVVGVAHI